MNNISIFFSFPFLIYNISKFIFLFIFNKYFTTEPFSRTALGNDSKYLLQDTSRGTHQFGLVLVGHSLGAGTAAILAILLKQDYPDLVCFSFAPPGGLLSMPAQQYSQEFITSVVVGKDVVPRIGLRQMESLRADLINAIKRSVDPKVRILL